MFAGHNAYIYKSSSSEELESLALKHGAVLSSSPLDASLTIVVTSSLAHIPAEMSFFRRRRVPVVLPCWVTESVAAGNPLPLTSSRLAQFNPKMFAGVIATSSQLPRHVKCNVRAAVEFFGGVYKNSLTEDCTLVITDGPFTEKVRAATGRPHVRCESVAWVQRCVDRGILCSSTNLRVSDFGLAALDAMFSSLDEGPMRGAPSADVSGADNEMVDSSMDFGGKEVTIDISQPSTSISLADLEDTFLKRKRHRDSSSTVELGLHRVVTRSFAREMMRQAEVLHVSSSGPITRSKAAVLQQLLQRISPTKERRT